MKYVSRFVSYIARCINFFAAIGAITTHAFKMVAKFSMEWPGQIYPILLITLINILVLFVFDVEGTIYSPLASMTYVVLIGIQWNSIRKSIVKRNIERKADDKERLEQFFESSGLFGIPGDVHFLKPYKERWYRSFYYKFKKIIRLSLYVYGETDEHGSYTKILVTKEILFHLNLMGCINQDNPDLTKKGMDYIVANS